ncbi:MAG: NirD/YgiW/YdeI family stress tolerance protein [Desulfovibrio sp.]|nr:NirD/YgiW/YdeI family stress tolerance protein [Desulfovibrio sp.]
MRMILSLLLLTMLAIPAQAAFNGPGASDGGFKGPTVGVEVTTVKQALDSKDDTPVLLTGKITGRQAGSNDKYIFKDTTGEMTVDIDKKIFVGRTVSPENTVRLSGKVDKDLMKPVKVDVKVLEILN